MVQTPAVQDCAVTMTEKALPDWTEPGTLTCSVVAAGEASADTNGAEHRSPRCHCRPPHTCRKLDKTRRCTPGWTARSDRDQLWRPTRRRTASR